MKICAKNIKKKSFVLLVCVIFFQFIFPHVDVWIHSLIYIYIYFFLNKEKKKREICHTVWQDFV